MGKNVTVLYPGDVFSLFAGEVQFAVACGELMNESQWVLAIDRSGVYEGRFYPDICVVYARVEW
jgi:hypothetical protein